MTFITQFDLPLFTIITTVFMILYYYKNYSFESFSSKLFYFILFSLLSNTLINITLCLTNGWSHPYANTFNYALTWLMIALYYIPILTCFMYFDYKIHRKRALVWKNLKRYMIAEYAIILLLLINMELPIIFNINSENFFIRGPLYILVPIVIYGSALCYAYKLWRQRNHAESRIIRTICYFYSLPVIASIIQFFNFGVSIFWPSMILVSFIAFMILERDDLMKDSLTRLFSRRYLINTLEKKLKDRQPFSVILIDMDEFKIINDTYGHAVGDQALIIMSSIIKSNLKHWDLPARFGGDEFVILLNDPNPYVGEIVIGRLNYAIREYNDKNLMPFALSISVGHHFIDAPINLHYKDIIEQVDKKMYHHKKSKKDAGQKQAVQQEFKELFD